MSKKEKAEQKEQTVVESEQQNGQVKSKKHVAAVTIAKTAILTAIAWILYVVVKFNLPFMFPSFLEMQISDLPALLGGFAMGPVWGCVIVVLKCLLKMPMTTTGCVGELADILVGVAFVLPASIIYKRYKTKKSALIGLLVGMACAVLMAVVANAFLLVPFYVNVFFDGSIEGLVGMVSSLYKGVTAETFYTYYILLAVIPFNLLRCIISGGITFIVYKRISKILHR